MAATCDTAGGHTVRFAASRSQGPRSHSGMINQPTRHPVMEWYLLTDPTTTAASLNSRALTHSRP